MSDLTKIAIVGAGGLGREVLAAIHACNQKQRRWDVVGFLDTDPKLASTAVCGIPVLGGDDWYLLNADKSLHLICAIGDCHARQRAVHRLTRSGCTFATVVHPDVEIPESVRIGPGTVVMAGTRFTTDASVGAHVVVYVNCSITHDVRIEDYCLIASGCSLSGACHLGTGVELGAGTDVLPGKHIGEWSVVGAGSVVVSDLPAHVTAVGVPCKVIKSHAV